MVYVIMRDGLEWNGGGTGRTHVLLLKALQTATTAANRRRGRFPQPMVAAAASRAAGGAMQLNAPRCRRLEQRSTGVTTASGTGDAADASRSRWGLQQPAVQRAAPCSSTHAPQTPGAADWASADSRHQRSRCRLVVLPVRASSPLLLRHRRGRCGGRAHRRRCAERGRTVRAHTCTVM